MGNGEPDRNSVRPHSCSLECSGQVVKAEDDVQAVGEEAVLSLEDEAPVEAEIKSDEIEAVDEEEEYECIPCLPAQYQPSRSGFLDHCVTHYPFRA